MFDGVWTFIYGSNSSNDRKELWHGLRRIAGFSSNLNWILFSSNDFNALLCDIERVGGNSAEGDAMEDFRSCIQDCELFEMRTTGLYFTWSNMQGADNRICRKLDRVFCNLNVLDKLNLVARVESNILSDHSPVFVQSINPVPTKKSSLKFLNIWHDEFLSCSYLGSVYNWF